MIRELTRTDMMAHRPYTAGAMCVMKVETDSSCKEFKLGLAGRQWRKESGDVEEDFSLPGRRKWRE
jgi:hypothetical protein